MMTHYTNTNNPVDFPKTVKADMNERLQELRKQVGDLTMKERVRELRKQVGDLTEKEVIDDSIEHGGLVTLFLNRFAEVIIRECVEICSSRVGNSDYNTGRMHCASDIKDHFGLK